MKIVQNIEVPTGNILIVQGRFGKLELVSLGDYGKENNIKADFLGLDREIKKIVHSKLMPLEKKWVVTVSSQYGCSMKCLFCDVPNVGMGINATLDDLCGQIETAIQLHPEITSSERLNIHFARMGEPTFNIGNILQASAWADSIYGDKYHIHPVISTMCPARNDYLFNGLHQWAEFKNNYMGGEAGLQISINSTDEEERERLFSGNALSIEKIGSLAGCLPPPKGRKYTLNFAIAGFEIDAGMIAKYFNPRDFMIKLTPMHKTHMAIKNDIKTEGDYTTIYPYLEVEEAFKRHGFDVLVFLASDYEDMSRITCGNAILTGSNPETPHRIVHI